MTPHPAPLAPAISLQNLNAFLKSSSLLPNDNDNPYNDRRFLKNGKPRLGIFSEKIFLEKLNKGEVQFSEALRMELELKRCGEYQKDQVIQAKIRTFGFNNFYFLQDSISEEQQERMNSTPSITFKNGQQMYAANPHHSSIGEIKLYLERGKMHRCQIKDLYCVYFRGTLQLQASVLKIDDGFIKNYVNYSNIFDFPQTISYYQDMEPKAKHARLILGHPIPDNFEHNDLKYFFINFLIGDVDIDKLSREVFKIKILDFKDNMYHVDIADNRHKSFIQRLIDQFRDTKLRDFYKPKPAERGHVESVRKFAPIRSMLHASATRTLQTQVKRASFNDREEPAPRYIGALGYFKNYLAEAARDHSQNKSYLQKRFPKVIVTDWSDPEHLAVQPVDNYVQTHCQFLEQLGKLKCIQTAETNVYKCDEPFFVGEHMLFRNRFGEPELGNWLRGVVVKRSCFNQDGMVIGAQSADKSLRDGTIEDLLKAEIIGLDEIYYTVRSTDYGYQRSISPIHMRHILNQRELKQIGTWTLRCRLFGVGPLPGKNRHLSSCIGLMDCWIRRCLLGKGGLNNFNAIIHSNLADLECNMYSYDNQHEISLFYHYEPDDTFEVCFSPRTRRTIYESLNWHLVERGLASSSCLYNPNKSSNIQLEEHVVNALVPHNMI